MKTIYNYNPETGVFIGADFADVSPLEPDVFLVPANATTEAPPVCGAAERPVFKNGQWVVEAIPQPSVPAPPTPAEVKASMWTRIKIERDRRRFEGGVKVGDHWFLSTAISTSEYNSFMLISAGQPDTAVLRAGWRTMDGFKVDMTPALVRQILVAGVAAVAAIDDAAQTHKAAMEASADPAAYDFSGGWPKICGE